jgi:PAS domain S-box-containing protein
LAEVFAGEKNQAVAYVPLSSTQAVLGALTLAFEKPNEFGPAEQAFVQALSDLAAQALERLRLFDSERQSRMAQAALAARLQTFLDAAPMGVAFLDVNLRYQHINRVLADLNRLPPEAHLRRTPRELWPNATPFFEKLLQQVIETGMPLLDQEYAGEGNYAGRYWRISYYPVRGDAGEIIGVGILAVEITDRKQAEAALRASESKFATAFNTSPTVLTITRLADGRIVEVNDSFIRMTGYTREEVLGRTPDELNLWAHPEQRQAGLADLLAGRSLREIEADFRMKDGTLRICLLAGELVALNGERHVMTALTDITERKRAETVLTEQARLLDLSSDAIIMRDENDRITYWSRGAEQMYGYAREEVLGQVVFTLLKVRFPQPLEEIKQILWREGHWEGELGQTRKDGSQITVLTRWIVDRAPERDGKPPAVLVINTDITERKRTDQALRENQEMLALAMRGGRIGAWWRDIETNAVWWSHELEEIFGLPPGGFEGSEAGFYEFVHPDDRPAVSQAVERAIASQTDYAVEFRFFRADGRLGWMDGRGRATYDADGKPQRLYGIGIDITERKRDEMDARFLADLSRIFSGNTDPQELMWQVSHKLAGHLSANRAGFCTFADVTREVVIHREYCDGVSSMAGAYRIDWMDARLIRSLNAGELLTINDTKHDPRTAPVYKAFLAHRAVDAVVLVPLLRMGRCVAGLFVARGKPQEWTAAEIDLLRTVAERTWLAVESARVQTETHAMNAILEARVAERTEALNQSREELRRLSAYVERTREDERTRIAREVHDELGGALTVLKMSLAQVAKRVDGNASAGERLDDMRAQIDSLVQNVRRISYDLRPSMLDDFGLLAAMEWQAHEWERRTGIACRLDFAPEALVELDDRSRTAVFRAFQESLTNIARHAQATEAVVSIQLIDGLMLLMVQDNGQGIRPEAMQSNKSLGLVGMRERMREVGGDVEIASVAGQGVTVTLRVPLNLATP